MNAKDRRKYNLEYEAINKRFRKKYFPKVLEALNSLVSSLIGTIRERGVREAMGELSMSLLNDKMVEPVKSLYKEVGLYHAKKAYREIRQEIGRKGLGRNEQWIQEIINYLNSTFLQYAVIQTNITLRDRLLAVIQEGIDNEMSVDEMIRLIKERNIAAVNAERIIRTEVGRAANTGVKVAAESFPYEMSKEWIAFRDARTRGLKPNDKKDHYHLDGVVVDFDEPFKDPRSGENIDYPQAPGGSAAMVINCRCNYAVVPKRDERGNLIARPSRLNIQIPVKSEDLNTNKEIAELINNIKFPDLSGTLNENKNDILSSLKEDIDIMKDDLQKSLHNVGRVNSMVLKSGNEQVAENVARIEKGFEQLEAIIKSIEVAPVVNIPDVKVDNTGVSEAINSIREDILNGLSELRKAVEKKKDYKVEFERDLSGFIKSPIKIVIA